jgi:hypothetical protein
MKHNIERISSAEQEEFPSLDALSECVGKVVDVADIKITVEVVRQILVPVLSDLLNKRRNLIQKGKHVEVLAPDDGSIRFRSVSSC